MNVAVTGGSGKIGRRVCRLFGEAGHQVTAVDRVAPPEDVDFIEVDLRRSEETRKALQGFEVVVHLAAIPDPFSDPPETVMSVNMTTTLNVFEAAKENGTSRVVYGCSESSTGFGIHSVALKPLYVPVDEEHPCWPHETYSLSKHFGELLAARYAHAFGLEVVSLRYAWVWMEACREAAERIVARSRAGEVDDSPWFGGYVSVADVARGCLLAAQYRFPADASPRHEAFFLTAADTFYPIPTLDLLARIYETPPPVKDPSYFASNPYASVFDIRKAQRLLGWQPEHDWRNFDRWRHLL